MMFNRTLCVAAVATLASSFALTACSDSAGGGSADSYKIGMLVALSGPAAQAGQHQRDGAEAAVAQINKDGGVDGRKLALVMRDDAGNPNTAVSGFNDIVRDRDVVGVFGSTFGSATLAIKPLLERNKIPVVAPNTTHEITNPASEWLFRGIISAETEVAPTVQALERILTMFPILRERSKQTAGSLAGGQQQMLAIGRALMARPRLLVLDEPSLGLAPLVLGEIFDVLHELVSSSDVAVLLVEQNGELTTAFVDNVYVLEAGRVVKSGRAGEMTRDDIARAYMGAET